MTDSLPSSSSFLSLEHSCWEPSLHQQGQVRIRDEQYGDGFQVPPSSKNVTSGVKD